VFGFREFGAHNRYQTISACSLMSIVRWVMDAEPSSYYKHTMKASVTVSLNKTLIWQRHHRPLHHR